MPEQLRIWRIGAGEALEEISRTPVDLEDRVETWVSKDISIVDPNLLVIGRQVPTDYGGYIDLLCLDANANLVVIELKRGMTPREVTAQAIDYTSWVKDLSLDRISEIANEYLGKQGPLETTFYNRFNEELPEVVNENHSIIVVASEIDTSTERIMTYLSETYGVSINAIQFQHFRGPNEDELLARLFLMEPETVESHVSSKTSSKRRKNITFEELEEIADRNGVGTLYRDLSASLAGTFTRKTRTSQMAFKAEFPSGKRVVFSLLPLKSSADLGLCYQAYSYRISELLGVPLDHVHEALPAGSEPWSYYPSAPDDYKGLTGYFKTGEDIQ
jgi:hypothetical protein